MELWISMKTHRHHEQRGKGEQADHQVAIIGFCSLEHNIMIYRILISMKRGGLNVE